MIGREMNISRIQELENVLEVGFFIDYKIFLSIDIIIWWANETPRLLIEVKKGWQYNSINADAKRLRQIIRRRGSQKEGLIVVYTEAEKSKTIIDRFEKMALKSDTKLIDYLDPIRRSEEDDILYWSAACFSV